MQTLALERQCKQSTASTQFPLFESTEKEPRNSNKARIDLRKTEYPILFNVAGNCLGWRVWSSKQDSRDERDVIWNDNYISEGQVRQLHFYQRINHFPGSHELGKKNLLAQNLDRMKSLFSDSFFPKTWLLPKDAAGLRAVLGQSQSGQYYIAKPECMSQGKGIFLFNSINQLPINWEEFNLVVQQYIHKPYLIEGLKFDFRIYVLLRSINPLRIYVFRQGLARFATVKYEQPSQSNYNNIMMHLTNYAINKRSPEFIFNTSNKDDNVGHKRSYTSVIELMRKQGVDTQNLQAQIDSLITKTILSGLTPLNDIYKRTRQNKEITSVCFQILGFDVMIDENLSPYLIEVNHTPSFTTDTPLDYNIKKSLIQDTLNMIRVDVEGKKEFMNGGRTVAIDKLISELQLRQLQTEEDSYQQRNQGGFRRIFPTDSAELMKIHDHILGIKPMRLYRINYQNLNKNRIAEINKKNNKNSSKYFPYILDGSDGNRDNYFDREDYYVGGDKQYLKFRLDHSMPIQSLFKTMYRKEDKYVVERSVGGKKYSYKNMWMLSRNEKLLFPFDKMVKEQEQEPEPLRLKKLQIDFLAPNKQKKISRNNIIRNASKSFQAPPSPPDPPTNGTSLTNRIVYPTKNILFNFQKHKKDCQDQDIETQSPQNQSKYLTVSPTKYTPPIEEDASESLIQPNKMTVHYENKFKRTARVRDGSLVKPAREVYVSNFSRKFSCEEKRLIIGYD